MKTEIRTLTCQPLFKTKIQNMIFFRTASLILTIVSQAKTLLGLSPKLQLRDISTQLLKQSFTLAMRKVSILCKVLNTTYARPASMCCKANILNFYWFPQAASSSIDLRWGRSSTLLTISVRRVGYSLNMGSKARWKWGNANDKNSLPTSPWDSG